MDPFFFLVPVALFFGVSWWMNRGFGKTVKKLVRAGRAAATEWDEALEALAVRTSMELAESSSSWAALYGDIDGVGVSLAIHRERDSDGDARTYTRVEASVDVPRTLSVTSEGVGTAFAKTVVGEDVRVGVPEFDRRVNIRGAQRSRVVAMFDATTREAVRRLLSAGGMIEDGAVIVQERGVTTDVDKLATLLGLTASVTRVLRSDELNSSDAVATRLAAGALGDPHLGYRLEAAKLLLTEFPQSSAAASAASTLLDADDIHLRVLAAGQSHVPQARAFAIAADALSDLHAPVPARILAAHLLSDRFPQDPRTTEALSGALHGAPQEVMVAALEASAKVGPLPLGLLEKCLESSSKKVRQATIVALASHGAIAEPMLLARLNTPATLDVTIAALGACASTGAVMPLRVLADDAGAQSLRDDIEQAIDDIQDRASGASGQLSMSANTAGQLSLQQVEVSEPVTTRVEVEAEVAVEVEVAEASSTEQPPG